MFMLYSLLTIMLLVGLGFLTKPFVQAIRSSKFSAWQTFFIGLFAILFSFGFTFGLYQLLGNQTGLKQWMAQGKQHYQLLEEVNHLGGLDHIILQIQNKLAENPDDAEGWFVLGKIYLAQHNYKQAKDTLTRAHQLQPDNPEISHFYEIANNY